MNDSSQPSRLRGEPFLDAAARADRALYFAKANGRNNVEANIGAERYST